jgi:hypothetical protein
MQACPGPVREVFVRLYEEGLIYRGKRLINWCPRCNTAIIRPGDDLRACRIEAVLHQVSTEGT